MGDQYKFKIPIGDWSNDGHGRTVDFFAVASKPIKAVREAYFAAKARLPVLCCPEKFCDEYEESEPSDEAVAALEAAGAPDVWDKFGPEGMAKIVVWFLNQGDPDLNVHLVDPLPMLPFIGYDKKRRHIGGFGYGLIT